MAETSWRVKFRSRHHEDLDLNLGFKCCKLHTSYCTYVQYNISNYPTDYLQPRVSNKSWKYAVYAIQRSWSNYKECCCLILYFTHSLHYIPTEDSTQAYCHQTHTNFSSEYFLYICTFTLYSFKDIYLRNSHQELKCMV